MSFINRDFEVKSRPGSPSDSSINGFTGGGVKPNLFGISDSSELILGESVHRSSESSLTLNQFPNQYYSSNCGGGTGDSLSMLDFSMMNNLNMNHSESNIDDSSQDKTLTSNSKIVMNSPLLSRGPEVGCDPKIANYNSNATRYELESINEDNGDHIRSHNQYFDSSHLNSLHDHDNHIKSGGRHTDRLNSVKIENGSNRYGENQIQKSDVDSRFSSTEHIDSLYDPYRISETERVFRGDISLNHRDSKATQGPESDRISAFSQGMSRVLKAMQRDVTSLWKTGSTTQLRPSRDPNQRSYNHNQMNNIKFMNDDIQNSFRNSNYYSSNHNITNDSDSILNYIQSQGLIDNLNQVNTHTGTSSSSFLYARDDDNGSASGDGQNESGNNSSSESATSDKGWHRSDREVKRHDQIQRKLTQNDIDMAKFKKKSLYNHNMAKMTPKNLDQKPYVVNNINRHSSLNQNRLIDCTTKTIRTSESQSSIRDSAAQSAAPGSNYDFTGIGPSNRGPNINLNEPSSSSNGNHGISNPGDRGDRPDFPNHNLIRSDYDDNLDANDAAALITAKIPSGNTGFEEKDANETTAGNNVDDDDDDDEEGTDSLWVSRLMMGMLFVVILLVLICFFFMSVMNNSNANAQAAQAAAAAAAAANAGGPQDQNAPPGGQPGAPRGPGGAPGRPAGLGGGGPPGGPGGGGGRPGSMGGGGGGMGRPMSMGGGGGMGRPMSMGGGGRPMSMGGGMQQGRAGSFGG